MTGLAYNLRNIDSGNITFMTIPFAPAPSDPNRVEWTSEADTVWANMATDLPALGEPSPPRRRRRRTTAPRPEPATDAGDPGTEPRHRPTPRPRQTKDAGQGGVLASTTRPTSADAWPRRADRSRTPPPSFAPGSPARPARPADAEPIVVGRPPRSATGAAAPSTGRGPAAARRPTPARRAAGRPTAETAAGHGPAARRRPARPRAQPGRAHRPRPADARRPGRPPAPARRRSTPGRATVAPPAQPVAAAGPPRARDRRRPAAGPPALGGTDRPRRRAAAGWSSARSPCCVLVALLAWPIGLLVWANGKVQHTAALSAARRTPPAPRTCSTGSDSRGRRRHRRGRHRGRPHRHDPRCCTCPDERPDGADLAPPRHLRRDPRATARPSSTRPSRGAGHRCSCRRSRASPA